MKQWRQSKKMEIALKLLCKERTSLRNIKVPNDEYKNHSYKNCDINSHYNNHEYGACI